MILIVDATGQLGRAVAHQLLKNGDSVRAMTRNPSKAMALKEQGASVIEGDLRDPRSLKDACQGVDRILVTSHSFDGRG